MLMYAHVHLVAVGSHARVARPTLAQHAGGLVDSDDLAPWGPRVACQLVTGAHGAVARGGTGA